MHSFWDQYLHESVCEIDPGGLRPLPFIFAIRALILLIFAPLKKFLSPVAWDEKLLHIQSMCESHYLKGLIGQKSISLLGFHLNVKKWCAHPLSLVSQSVEFLSPFVYSHLLGCVPKVLAAG